MKNIRELTLIFGATGEHAATQVRGADGIGRNLLIGDLDSVLAGVDEAALLRIDALKQEIKDLNELYESLKSEYAAFKASATRAAESAIAIIDDPKVNAEQTVVAVRDIGIGMLKNKIERDLAAADKVIDEAIKARAKLLTAAK